MIRQFLLPLGGCREVMIRQFLLPLGGCREVMIRQFLLPSGEGVAQRRMRGT